METDRENQNVGHRGKSFRQDTRTVLGEISSNTGRLQPRNNAKSKKQAFRIFEDGDENSQPVKLPNPPARFFSYQSSSFEFHQVQDENLAPVAKLPPKAPEFWADKIAKLPFVIHEDHAGPPSEAESSVCTSQTESVLLDKHALSDYRQDTSILSTTTDESENDSPMVLDASGEFRVPPIEPDNETCVFDVDEYREEIYVHLRECEQKHLPKWNYMTKQPDITYNMRQILVDWLVEVSEEYKLQNETVYLAVSYIDRFLSYMSVQRAKLQLVGTACMFIASKYEEIYPPELSEFCYITDDTYNKKQVLKMEHLVLKVLGFDLAVPTTYVFVNLYGRMTLSDEESIHLAQYLTELSLMDAETYLCYPPSVVAAAAVALSRHTLGHAAWTPETVKASGYTVEHIKDCLVNLHTTFSNAHSCPQQAIVEKYKSSKYNYVANITPIPIV